MVRSEIRQMMMCCQVGIDKTVVVGCWAEMRGEDEMNTAEGVNHH